MVVTEALERAAEEAKRREVEEGMSKAEEVDWSEVQRLVAEWWIESLKRMEAERLEADLWQETEIQKEAKL